jgi:arsenate reductase
MTKSKSVSTIYHKSSCITCKKTISEIERLKVDIQKRDFFEEPFSESELKKIVKLSGLSSFDLLRKRDKMFKELKLDSTKYSENELVKLMVKYPGLIKRPIIIGQNKVQVGKMDVKNLK